MKVYNIFKKLSIKTCKINLYVIWCIMCIIINSFKRVYEINIFGYIIIYFLAILKFRYTFYFQYDDEQDK